MFPVFSGQGKGGKTAVSGDLRSHSLSAFAEPLRSRRQRHIGVTVGINKSRSDDLIAESILFFSSTTAENITFNGGDIAVFDQYRLPFDIVAGTNKAFQQSTHDDKRRQ